MRKNYSLKYFSLFFVISTLLCSCGARKERSLFNATTDIVTDTIKQVFVVNDQGLDSYYTIKTNDLLAIRNVQNKEWGANTSVGNSQGTAPTGSGGAQTGQTYEVQPDGSVNLPAVGKVVVAGLNRREAAQKIEAIYKAKLLPDPIIQLNIVNLKVTLLGEFNKQGNFLIERDNTTLIDMIGEAGGISKTADPKTCKIIRGDRAKPEIIYVNLNDINSLASKKLILQNNDIIVLQSTKGAATSDKLQGFSNILQPLLVVVNLAVLIFTISR